MTDETKAAVERLRQMRADANDHDGGYPATDEGRRQSLLDHAAIADWALPLLDPTPIDEAWLRSVGGNPHIESDTGMLRLYWHGEGKGFDLDIQTSNAGAYSRRLRHITTRGQLRTLCQCLGIELKEPLTT